MPTSFNQTRSLAATLGQLLISNPKVCILDYKEGFVDFWQRGLQTEQPTICGKRLSWSDDGMVVVVVGVQPPDTTPRSKCLTGINVADHLGALSWVAAWRLRYPGSPTRFCIIGFESADHEDCAPSALTAMFSAQGPGERPFVPRIVFFSQPDLPALINWLRLKEQMDEKVVWSTLPLLRSCIWDGLSSTREKHHAFSNVLGAFLLSAQVQRTDNGLEMGSIQHHLTALIQSIGVETEPSPDEANGLRKTQSWIEPGVSRQLGGAVLLDDMAELWGQFLQGALGFSDLQGQSLVVTGDKFFEELQALPSRLRVFLDCKKDFLTADVLIPGRHKIGERFVLFLDLRLFPDPESLASDDQRLKAKDKFFQNLAHFGLALLDSPRNLPWADDHGISCLRKELERFLANVTRTEVPRRQFQGIPPEEALLPRLLSLLDPTLPIVIFSSTHHSDLTDPFRNYGNIITTFRKPTLTGMTRNWSELIDELQCDFCSALKQAASILAARNLLRKLEPTRP